jgi:hypothetical protein
MNEVTLPPLAAAQEELWLGLLDVAERVPKGWCLIGGQMVHLHCWERDASPNRPIDDIDTVLDIRTENLGKDINTDGSKAMPKSTSSQQQTLALVLAPRRARRVAQLLGYQCDTH